MTSIFIFNAVEVGCLLITVLIFILISLTRTASSYRDRLFKLNLLCFGNSCVSSIVYNGIEPLFKIGGISEVFLYITHNSFYINLLVMFLFYVAYVSDLFNVSIRELKVINCLKWVIFLVSSAIILTSNFTHFGYYIEGGEIYRDGFPNGIVIGYSLDILVILYIIVKYRKTMVREIYNILVSIISISVVIMGLQEIYLAGKFTVITFLIPIIAMFYCLHSIAYDLNTGTISLEFLEKEISQGRPYGFIFLFLEDFNIEKMTPEFKQNLLAFNTEVLKKYKKYNLRENNFIMVYNNQKEQPDFEWIVEQFKKVHDKMDIDFKVLIDDDCRLDTVDKLREYCNYTVSKLENISFNYADEEIRNDFRRREAILEQLKDIKNKADLEDERVLVYCQPVLNKKTGRYSTGEALMRLNLPGMGMIYPDEFISFAEQNDLLHPMSNIVLNKTCKAIRELMDQGYDIERISVNYSVDEFSKIGFKTGFFEIIENNNIPVEKIAIELTETQDFHDFEKVYKNMNRLCNYNIKFYLDDFGTGYSNFERLIKLPFDIIKFDKSLLVSMKTDASSKYMVSNVSKMFKEIGYNILFEGVEDADDEDACSKLGFDYLQGYKYSKPIEIEKLSQFLEKN